MKLVAIVLAFNERQHLPRCLASLSAVASQILVVDSYSTDDTLEIARGHGARVVQHAWVNQSVQFNWALTQLDDDTAWVLRLDADEYLTPELAEEIKRRLPGMPADVDGAYCARRMIFQGRLLRHGGFPVRVLRLFRHGRGRCESRWMDEHIKVAGVTVDLEGELIDDNLNSLTWWTAKHNHYASREAVDLLNREYGFLPLDSISRLRGGSQPAIKRWLKENVYARLPRGARAFAYFFYRFVLRLGFLDGRAGATFHFLQGFWYRYLADAKVVEVKRYMEQRRVGVVQAIEQVLEIKVGDSPGPERES